MTINQIAKQKAALTYRESESINKCVHHQLHENTKLVQLLTENRLKSVPQFLISKL